MKKLLILIIGFTALLTSCKTNKTHCDAYGQANYSQQDTACK